MTANIILTIVAALSLFLAIIALKAAKTAHDKYESLHYDLKARGEYTATKFQNLRGELDSLGKELLAVGAGVSNVKEALDAGFELRANINEDQRRMSQMLFKLAEKNGLYWQHTDGHWSEGVGNSIVGAAAGLSQAGGQVRAQGARNRATKRRS